MDCVEIPLLTSPLLPPTYRRIRSELKQAAKRSLISLLLARTISVSFNIPVFLRHSSVLPYSLLFTVRICDSLRCLMLTSKLISVPAVGLVARFYLLLDRIVHNSGIGTQIREEGSWTARSIYRSFQAVPWCSVVK